MNEKGSAGGGGRQHKSSGVGLTVGADSRSSSMLGRGSMKSYTNRGWRFPVPSSFCMYFHCGSKRAVLRQIVLVNI